MMRCLVHSRKCSIRSVFCERAIAAMPRHMVLAARLQTSTAAGDIKISTAAAAAPAKVDGASPLSRIGIGGSKLSQIAAAKKDEGHCLEYASVVATSLENGVRTFESGHPANDGEFHLKNAYKDAVQYLESKEGTRSSLRDEKVTFVARFGYRIFKEDEPYEDDVIVGIKGPIPDDYDGDDDDARRQESDEANRTPEQVAHNLSRAYVETCLADSPLVKLRKEINNGNDASKVDLVYMAHNPEAQGAQESSKKQRKTRIKRCLTEAMTALERGVAQGLISSYGVSSNGLSLPKSHEMHLDWMDVLEAASDAVRAAHPDNDTAVAAFSTLQLPANLLETKGLQVAKAVKSYLASEPGDTTKIPHLPSNIHVHLSRPLTCYPDGGTGSATGKTTTLFKLLDYQIPATTADDDHEQKNAEKVWTHQIPKSHSTPPNYTKALNRAMAHFDATPLLEAAQERKLSTEERETLDGCKLLQSMMHDLDQALGLEDNTKSLKITSLEAHERELYHKVIPLIRDTFEELDEESSNILQEFFAAHGNAVRHGVAKRTRRLVTTDDADNEEDGEDVNLVVGRDGGWGTRYNVPKDQTLQEFALQYLLRQGVHHTTTSENNDDDTDDDGNFLADKVIIGCTKANHVLEAIMAAHRLKDRIAEFKKKEDETQKEQTEEEATENKNDMDKEEEEKELDKEGESQGEESMKDAGNTQTRKTN